MTLTLNEEISKQIDISWASQEFFDFCKNSNIYDPEQHSIHIHLTRRYVFSGLRASVKIQTRGIISG